MKLKDKIIFISRANRSFKNNFIERKFLKGGEFNLSRAYNIEEAELLSKGKKFRAFILEDDLLSEKNLLALKRLRKIYPVKPIILFAKNYDYDLVKVIEAGVDEIVDKDSINEKNLQRILSVSEIKRRLYDSLQRNKKNLVEIINNSLNGIIVVDKNNKIVLANKKAQELFGVNKKLHNFNFATPLILGEKTEVELVNKNGEISYFEITATEITYLEKPHILINFYEITERKDEKEKIKLQIKDLTDNENKYKELFLNSLAGIYITNIKGEIIEANNQLAEILGYDSVDELKSKNFLNFLAEPASREKFISDLLGKKSLKNTKHKLIKKNGEIITVLKNSLVKESVSKDGIQLLHIIFDITDLERQENILSALGSIAGSALNNKDFEDFANEILKKLGLATEVERCYIFYFDELPEGEIFATQKYEWVNENVISQLTNYELQNFPMIECGFGRWIEEFKKNNCIKGNIKDFPEDERKILEPQGIKSILALPIFYSHKLFGFIGFDSVRFEREWKTSEINTLRMAATLFIEVFNRNLSDRKIKEQLKTLINIYKIASAGYFEYDHTKRELLFKQGSESILGFQNNITANAPIKLKSFLTKDELRKFNKKYSVIENEMKFDHIFKVSVKNNTEKYFLVRGEFFVNESREVKAKGLFMDITDSRRVKEKLSIFETVVKKSPAPVLITDKNQKILFVNESWEKLTGWTFEEVSGRSPNILKSGKTENSIYAEMLSQIYSGKEWKGEILNKKKNGELFWELMVIKPLFNDEGEITHFISVALDITNEKNLYYEVLKAKEKIESVDRLKTEFLAQISHEFRTPVNVIINYNNIIYDELGKELTGDLEFVKTGIEESTERLIKMVDSTILISQMLSGNYLPNFIKINLYSELLLPIFTKEKKYASNKGLNFDIEVHAKEPIIQGDIYSLEELFGALVDNAIKYTEKGSIKILIEEKSVNKILVVIKDTGRGMKRDFIKRSFVPFAQEEEGFARKFEGMGLGLTLVSLAAGINNVDLSVESEEGKGTSIYLTFVK